MIAASEPQEFIPSGRQHVVRHPGATTTSCNEASVNTKCLDTLVLHRLKHVSITEKSAIERWSIRESNDYFHYCKNVQEPKKIEDGLFQPEKNGSEMSSNATKSWSWKTIDPNLFGKSECNLSKSAFTKSRFSSEHELCKNDSKSNKSQVSFGATNVRLKVLRMKCKEELLSMEEELYIKGNTAILSQGLMSINNKVPFGMSRPILCSYTMENPIKHAFWCTFHLERPTFAVKDEIYTKPEEPIGKSLPCICLIDSCNLRVFTKKSENFIASLQFPISAVWTTKFGILVEKETPVIQDSFHKISGSGHEHDFGFGNVYSLAHPLDDFCPVVLKHNVIQYLNSHALKIIFTSCDPSICLVYDSNTGLHVVYKLRRIRSDEWIELSVSKIKLCNTIPSPITMSSKVKQNLSFWGSQGAGLPLATGSPCPSRTASLSNLISPHNSRSHSPMATISRCQSPSVSPFVSGGGWINHSSYLHHEESNTTYTGTHAEGNAQIKPINPELCLEHIWTETTHSNKSNIGITSGPASKAFLCNDLIGQSYLCYLVPVRGHLMIVKMDLTNDHNLIFGTYYFVHAKDAVVVPSLQMIVILEETGQIMLQSGPMPIGKVLIGGVSAEFTSCLYYITQNVQSHFKSPFPRRSSLLPHCATPAAAPKFDENLISPVYPHSFSVRDTKSTNVLHSTLLNEPIEMAANSSITLFRDAVGDRVTLQYSDNTYYRVRLPPLASGTLVESCLNALRLSLQRDVMAITFCKWYAARNAPGPTELTVEQEWNLFSTLLYSLLGYNIEKLNCAGFDNSVIIDEVKRQRPSPEGTGFDWEDMLRSKHQKSTTKFLVNLLRLKRIIPVSPVTKPVEKGHMNTSAILFPYFRLILFTLHLLYEELKLSTIRLCELPFLAKFLHQLSSDLRLRNYVVYYWKDFPELCPLNTDLELCQMTDQDLIKVNTLSIMTVVPVSIMQQFYDLLRGVKIMPYPYIKHVNPTSKNMLQICALVAAGHVENYEIDFNSLIKVFAPPGSRIEPEIQTNLCTNSYRKWNWAEKIVVFLTELGISRTDLSNIPVALSLVIHEALWLCRENPPTDWPAESYYLLQRPDLAVQVQNSNKYEKQNYELLSSDTQLHDIIPGIKHYELEQEDGMEDIENSVLKLRFCDDQRVGETRRLLQSSEPVQISVIQGPDVSDHDFIEEQEKHLYAICTRTMALPVGRGMFTLRTTTPIVTETLLIPKLCLNGRAPPRGTTVELSHVDTPTNMNLWPLFHNGVAAGLSISPDASDINSTWITFNKPKTATENSTEHAGFLMGLGLNGHLKKLGVLNMYEYLIKFHEMTSIGLLLGLAAAKRGTMDTYTTKMLSIHIEALLPPTSMELDIQQNIQVAALLGIGLVYQGSAHRHMTEVLLTEIGRPPGPEMENSVDRESYSLAAGLALGLVALKQGDNSSGFADLGVPDALHYYMVGGNKRPLTGAQKEKYKVPSFQIREGLSVNLDVTAPGATLALGLMYIGTGNRAVADWMQLPDTQYLLDLIRPDFIMLRTISKALILWDDIESSTDWIDKQVPETIRPYCLQQPGKGIELDIDYEAINQAYCNIVAGACFALGLRYAGSADENTFRTLYHYCEMFTSLSVKSIADLAGKPTFETCLNLILLSLGMVMAGTGRLEVLRLCRHLRKRVGVTNSSVVTYGSHIAIHMALGLLFLGGGRYTLSNSPQAVAAMLCAFFPKFPTHSNDNRYHLQAFRHLYVLAAEPRLLVPRDVLTGKLHYTHLSMVKLNGYCLNVRAPCLLPSLNTLARVSVQDERYWPIVFERGRNWEQLSTLLESSGFLDVKQKAGCLSYLEDPKGARSLLALTLTQSSNIPWTPLPSAISSFSSEPTVKYFTDYFLSAKRKNLRCNHENTLRQLLTRVMYECVTKDKVAILPLWITIVKAVDNLKSSPRVYDLWQLKLLFTQILSISKHSKSLILPDVCLGIQQQILTQFDNWEKELIASLKSYITGSRINLPQPLQFKLASYVSFFDLPFGIQVRNNNCLQLFQELKSLNVSFESVSKVVNILNK